MSVLNAAGAGIRHRRRWLLRDLDVRVEPGETVAVAGPPGSGRTSTLLALAGRLRLSAGKVTLTGTAELAHVADVAEPEPVFTVLEHVRERLTLLGRSRRAASEVHLHGLDPGLTGRELSPYQRHLLGLVLAEVSEPALIALDGVDTGLDRAERDALWTRLAELSADGVAVLVTAREVDPSLVDRVILLSDPRSGEAGQATVLSAAEYAAMSAPAVPAMAAATDAAATDVDPPADDEAGERDESVESREADDEAGDEADEEAGDEADEDAGEEKGTSAEAGPDEDPPSESEPSESDPIESEPSGPEPSESDPTEPGASELSSTETDQSDSAPRVADEDGAR